MIEVGWRRSIGARFLERAEPFWTDLSADKLQKSLEMGNFGTGRAAKGGSEGIRGWGDMGGVWEECWGACLSSERSERGRVSRAV